MHTIYHESPAIPKLTGLNRLMHLNLRKLLGTPLIAFNGDQDASNKSRELPRRPTVIPKIRNFLKPKSSISSPSAAPKTNPSQDPQRQ